MAQRSAISRLNRIASTAYAVVVIVPAAIVVVFLVGSLILSGGQVSETMDAKWAVVVAYPLFAVSTALLVALAALSVVLAIVVVATARADDLPGLRGLIGPTVAAIISSVLLSGLVPDGGTRVGDVVWGDQWIAAPISAVALVILLAGTAIVKSRAASAVGPNR